MTEDERWGLIKRILRELNKRKVRATYSVVACLLDTGSQSVSKYLCGRRPEASWVVRKDDGKPSGYECRDCHPDLGEKPHMKSCWELRKWLHLSRPSKHNPYCDGG